MPLSADSTTLHPLKLVVTPGIGIYARIQHGSAARDHFLDLNAVAVLIFLIHKVGQTKHNLDVQRKVGTNFQSTHALLISEGTNYEVVVIPSVRGISVLGPFRDI